MLILKAILVAEDAQVDVAALHLIEVHLIRAAVTGRQLLEEEHFGDETAQHGISEEKSLQIRTDFLELPLNAANKYSETCRRHDC